MPYKQADAIFYRMYTAHIDCDAACLASVNYPLGPCAGDQHGNIRVWDLTANACSCELVPEVGTAVRSLTVALDGSLVVAANNAGPPAA